MLLHHLVSKLAIVFSLNDYTVKSLTHYKYTKVAFQWESGFRNLLSKAQMVSPPRNPFSGWIPINKSKSGCHGLPFYRSIGKSEKRFANYSRKHGSSFC